ncbi:MAG: molybdopterin-dependent oxidoreductase, partial [Thermomicrobiales bacterium]
SIFFGGIAVSRTECEAAERVPRQARVHATNPRLRLDGCVQSPLVLTPSEVGILRHEPFLGALTCNESGGIPARSWSGVRIADLLALVTLTPEARFVRISAGPYGYPISLAETDQVLLCDRQEDRPLGIEHGGPWRLVVPGAGFFTSIKWVDRLEVTMERPDDSATRIALARARVRNTKERV